NAGIRFTITKETERSFMIFLYCRRVKCKQNIYISFPYSGRGKENLEIDIREEKRREYVIL
ncbi:MAG: radical SAM/SPASM domain-containing protein, partial [Arcobacter sp.]|nr:radical SAM/SPASM domain-containing protein [Arcobacter sp.]